MIFNEHLKLSKSTFIFKLPKLPTIFKFSLEDKMDKTKVL